MRSAGAFSGFPKLSSRVRDTSIVTLGSRRQVHGNRQVVAKCLDSSGSGGLNGFDIAFGIHKAACLPAAGIELDLIGFGIELAR